MNSKKVDGINSVAVLLGVILLLWGSLEKASNLEACGYGDILSQHFSYIAATAHDQVQTMTVGGITKAESKIVGSEEIEERRIQIVKWIVSMDVEITKKDESISRGNEYYQ